MHLCSYREREVVISIAARGVVYVIKTSWLEDCDREKKQVPVLQEYSAYDLVFPKANLGVTGIVPMDQSKSSSGRQSFQTDQVVGIKDLGVKMPESLEKNKQEITQRDSNVHVKSTNVFKGKTFCFSNLFPGKR
ncbi:DNA topoisomerase 2-binding-like protein, partial [Trifolium medium]|nr:DNA topoisomerase 2-binding-like protein [Trifolium medium]